MTSFSNLPPQNQPSKNSVDGVVQTFDNFYKAPVQMSADVFNAMTGFFESKGFDPNTSKSLAVVLIKQAQQDQFDPMTILDSFKAFDATQLSNLATQILNYNRSKTSYLGMVTTVDTYKLVQRNIIP